MAAATSTGRENMASLKAARCRLRSEKKERAGVPLSWGIPACLATRSIESEGNGRAPGVREGGGRDRCAGLGLHLLHSLMKDVDIPIESLLELVAQARQACSQLLIRGLQRLDLAPGRVECFLVGNHLRRPLCPVLLRVLHGLLNRGKLIADTGKILGNVRSQSLNVILTGVDYRELSIHFIVQHMGLVVDLDDLILGFLDVILELGNFLGQHDQSLVAITVELGDSRREQHPDQRCQQDQDDKNLPSGGHRSSPASNSVGETPAQSTHAGCKASRVVSAKEVAVQWRKPIADRDSGIRVELTLIYPPFRNPANLETKSRLMRIRRSSGDTIPNCLGEFRQITENNERASSAVDVDQAGTPRAAGVERLRPRENGQRLIGGEWEGSLDLSVRIA